MYGQSNKLLCQNGLIQKQIELMKCNNRKVNYAFGGGGTISEI
jgi:hypothetical protein